MANSEKVFLLINGSFQPEEAGEMLGNIFFSKIRFHELKNFSLVERFGEEDPRSAKRIRMLKQEIKKIRRFLEKAKAGNQLLEITSVVRISLQPAGAIQRTSQKNSRQTQSSGNKKLLSNSIDKNSKKRSYAR